ncbi:rod-binding protein [Novosphingobium sp. KA1]|uniref:rod-binding protein n=1 Tax=Novosphingobium sp. (strain KA1) TaxID=164608 RepID=UPI001A8C5D4A|nr:rod-binding protein [Novosphingobium sp. KA1]QSR16571.1 flagellar biosynthesis protein FlgJ [Novosphingobium sp. KA1]
MSMIAPPLSGLTPPPAASDRDRLSATAKQFEAMFVRQMLAAARKADFGGDALFGSQALDTFRQMQDEHFADVTAQSGTLGLAAILEAQMARFLPATQNGTAPAPTPTPTAAPTPASTPAPAGEGAA